MENALYACSLEAAKLVPMVFEFTLYIRIHNYTLYFNVKEKSRKRLVDLLLKFIKTKLTLRPATLLMNLISSDVTNPLTYTTNGMMAIELWKRSNLPCLQSCALLN